ncbi:MAG: Uma2 family endonuclease [Leptospiraceae bacterium]|nr:Uma2 family endonuclease [Leptospiraceae bacterium]
MSVTLTKLTVSEMENSPEKWERFELYRGEPIEMTFTKPIHARTLSRLSYLFYNWIENNKGFGEVYGGEAGVRFSEDTRYCFDLAWSSKTLPENDIPSKSLDLMIEIISDGNDMNLMMLKVDDYLKYGAREVWLVFPARKCIQVFLPDNTSKTFTISETISTGEWMKGFELKVSDLFNK